MGICNRIRDKGTAIPLQEHRQGYGSYVFFGFFFVYFPEY